MYNVAPEPNGGTHAAFAFTVSVTACTNSVSYTHLDVYKRQATIVATAAVGPAICTRLPPRNEMKMCIRDRLNTAGDV